MISVTIIIAPLYKLRTVVCGGLSPVIIGEVTKGKSSLWSKKGLTLAIGSNLGVALLFGLLITLLLSGVLFFHKTTFFTNLDNVDQFYTWYQKLAISFHHGYLPIWNANVFSGQSFAGELQPGIFYPLNILWVAIFGSAQGISQQALDFLVALHFVIAAFGCYLFLKQLGAKKWAAFLAGLTFAFSGVLALRSVSQTAIFFGLALLPYPLYFLAKYHGAVKKVRWLVASGLALGLIILSGHIEPFYHALLALVIFEAVLIYKDYSGFANIRRQVINSSKNLAIIIICAAAIAAPQLILSAQYLPHTYRVQAGGYSGPSEKISYGDFSKAFSVDIHEYANLIDPVGYQIRDGNNLFIGLVPLFTIALVVFWGRQLFKRTVIWTEHAIFAKSLLVFSVIAMLGYATWFAVVLYKLPFVYQIRQLGRYSVLFHLSLMIILAAAIAAASQIKLSKKQKLAFAAAGIFLAINSLYLFLLRDHIFSLHFTLQTTLLASALLSFALFRTENAKRIVIGTLIIASAAVNGLWFLPNIKSDIKTPKVYSLAPGLVDVLQQTNGKYRVELHDNTLPVNIGNIYNVQTIGGYGATIYAPYYQFTHMGRYDNNFTRDLLGVQLEVTKHLSSDKEILYSDPSANLYVIKRESTLPKMFTSDKVGSTIRTDYHPLSVTTIKYTDNDQKYSLSVVKDTNVIMSEIAYPGWKLKIDGQAGDLKTYTIGNTPLLKEFMLPAGSHIVELKYQPFNFL